MPRKPRFFLPGVAVHAVQRGHSREPVFYEDQDYQVYLCYPQRPEGRGPELISGDACCDRVRL